MHDPNKASDERILKVENISDITDSAQISIWLAQDKIANLE